jgi:branched-chain amino acid transport system permease protein
LLISVAVAIYLVASLNNSRTGRAFDAIRQDEAVAVSLGVAISRYQLLAFALSGALAGYFGALEAFHVYSLEPNQFGFPFLVAVFSYVVLGGRHSVWGPVVGTAVLVALPELSRPLADYRMLVYGLLLILVINFMPRGIVDTWIDFRKRRLRVQAAQVREKEAA